VGGLQLALLVAMLLPDNESRPGGRAAGTLRHRPRIRPASYPQNQPGGVPTHTPLAHAPAPPGPADAPAPGTPALAPPGPAPAPEPPGPAVVAPPGPVSGPPPPGPPGAGADGAVVVTLTGVVMVVVTVEVVGLLLLPELHAVVNELRAIAAATPAATETRVTPLPVM